MAIQKGIKQVTSNKKAWHDYFVDEKYEAGIELVGTEVKSIRLGQINQPALPVPAAYRPQGCLLLVQGWRIIRRRHAYQPLRKGKHL